MNIRISMLFSILISFAFGQDCLNATCWGAYVGSKANFSADPCVDFFEFACGGMKNGEYTDDLLETHYTVKPKIGAVFRTSHPTDGALNKINEFYRACDNMDFTSSGLAQAVPHYSSYLTWDTSASASEKKRNRTLSMAYMNLLTEADGFLGTASFPSLDDESHEILLIASSGSIDDEALSSWLGSWLGALGSEFYDNGWPNSFDLDSINATVVYLETIISQATGIYGEASMSQIKELMLKCTRYSSLSDLEAALGDAIDWVLYYQTLFGEHSDVGTIDATWPGSIGKTILVHDASLRAILDIINDDSKANELMDLALVNVWGTKTDQMKAPWNGITGEGSLVSWPMKRNKFGIKPLTRDRRRLQSSNHCDDDKLVAFGSLVLKPYYDQHFDETIITEVKTQATAILNEFNQGLDLNTWMEDATKHEAHRKAEALGVAVGMQENLISDEKFATYLNRFGKVDDYHLENVFRYWIWRNRESLRNPWGTDAERIAEGLDWEGLGASASPLTSNAYYNPLWNKMYILMGILDTPVWSPSMPSALKYGGLNMIIGHEFTHGFDNDGRNYNADGNLIDWWTANDATDFDNQAQCYSDRYSSIPVTLKYGNTGYMDGDQILDEVIADTGVDYSFASFVSQQRDFSTLPHTNDLSAHQLFWLKFGQLWCEVPYDVDDSDTHPQASGRIVGGVSVSRYFARSFQCASGTPMNPYTDETRCSLWATENFDWTDGVPSVQYNTATSLSSLLFIIMFAMLL